MILEMLEDRLEFTINLDITKIFEGYCGNTDKALSFSEDVINKNDLKFNVGDSQEARIKIRDGISKIMLQQVKPIIENVLNKFDGYSLSNPHPSGSSSIKDKNEISYAFYFNVTKEIDYKNVTKQMNKALSLIIIRFANHINKSEKIDLKRLNIPQKMNIKLPPLTEETVKSCVFDILEFHTDVLGYIENHPKQIFDTFEDLGSKFVNKLKELQTQGDFSDQF